MTVTQMQMEIQTRVEKASAMGDGELIAALTGAREVMWGTILDLAVYSVEAERRNLFDDEISDLINAFIPKHRKRIASGQVSPRAWMKYVDRPSVLSVIALLSFEEQEAFVDGKRVKVYGTIEGDKYDPRSERLLAPHEMSDDQIRYVFKQGGAGPRSKVEQMNEAAKIARKAFTLTGMLKLSLDEEMIERLTWLAQKSGKTVQQFCKEWLKKAK